MKTLKFEVSFRIHVHNHGVWGFPGGTNGKVSAYQCKRHKRHGSDPWVGKILWRRAWQPTLVFLPGESQTEEPGGLESLGSQRVGYG